MCFPMFLNPKCSKYSFFPNEPQERKEKKWLALGGLAWFPVVTFTGTYLTKRSYSTASCCLGTVGKENNV